MTPRELPLVWHPITCGLLANGAIVALDAMGVSLTRACVRLAVAQMLLETGGRTSPNWCLSGIKTSPRGAQARGCCWQYFSTTEYFTTDQVEVAKKLGPVRIVQAQSDGKIKIWVDPKHPYCCFRAYETLEEALADHFTTLQRKFSRGWAGLLAGDARAFVEGLHDDRYYTAPMKDYDYAIRTRLKQEATAISDTDIVWGDIQ